MVVKNSKYDKQAKRQYMVKHGLLPQRTEKPMRPKWSSKKKNNSQEFMKLDIDEMTSDWDSDVDEDIVNYFYPQIGEELFQIPLDHKRRIKRQIIEDLKLQRNELFNSTNTEEKDEELDGIYLGSQPEGPSQPEVLLSEFLPQIPISKRKPRKLPINEDDEDILTEYGIENYKETIREKDDYDVLHKKKLENRNINDIPVDDLIGFKVGQDSLADISIKAKRDTKLKELSEEEIKKEDIRASKSEQAKLYLDMKQKFGNKSNVAKVIELNNLDNSNPEHVNYLNSKILLQNSDDTNYNIDEDLDALLGSNIGNPDDRKPATPAAQENIDDFLNSLSLKETTKPTKLEPQQKKPLPNQPSRDIDFLDLLLD